MSADGSHDEVRAAAADEKTARRVLAVTLSDVEDSCTSIDAECRKLVKDVLDSIEMTEPTEEDGNAADFLGRIAKIWSHAHNIRRAVEVTVKDEPESEVRQ